MFHQNELDGLAGSFVCSIASHCLRLSSLHFSSARLFTTLPVCVCVCVCAVPLCIFFHFLFNCFLFRLFEWIRWSPLTVLKNVTMVTNVHLCLAYETSWTYTHFSDPFIRPIYAFVRMQAIRSCFHSLDYYSHTYTFTPRHSLTHLSAATCVHVRLHFTFSLFSNFHHSTSEIQSISV